MGFFSKILGGGLINSLFERLGMPWMSNLIKIAAGVMTQRWDIVAREVFSLVSQFGNSWMDSASQNQPLGSFGNNQQFDNFRDVTSARTPSFMSERLDSDSNENPLVRMLFGEVDNAFSSRAGTNDMRFQTALASRQ